MPMVKLNGITIPTFKDTVAEEIVFSGDILARAISGALIESRTSRKRQWNFITPPMRSADANRYRMWIEGVGLGWNFNSVDGTNRQAYSRSGQGCSFALVGAVSPTFIKYGANAIKVGASEAFGFLYQNRITGMPNWAPTSGWTMAFWSYRTVALDGVGVDGYYHYVLVGTVSHTASASANPASVTQYRNGVAGVYNAGRLINVTVANDVSLCGNNQTAGLAGAAKDYDDWTFLPFAIPAAWVTELYNFALVSEMGEVPVLKASGDFIPDTSPVEVIGRVRTIQNINARLGGASGVEPNVKQLSVTLFEV